MSGGGAHKVSPLVEKLLIIYGYWEKESKFPSEMRLLKGYHALADGTTYMYIDTVGNDSVGLKREDTYEARRKVGIS